MKINKMIILLIVTVLLTGCSDQTAVSQLNTADKAAVDETVPKTTVAEDTSINSDSLLATDDEIVNITEKMFIAQTNDVYINTDDYMGKTLQYEGFVMSFFDETTQKTYYYVIRYGPGCCGYDANAGFEILTKDGEYPVDNEWVQVTGVLGTYIEGEYEYLYLDVTDLQVLEERGAESVTQ